MSSREQVLAAVRGAVRDAAAGPIPRDYRRKLDLARPALIDLLESRLADYRAEVRRVDRTDLGRSIGNELAGRQAGSVVIPDDLDPQWLTTVTCKVIRDSDAPAARDLDRVDAVITGCATAVAQTGTIVLDGGDRQGRRAISLVPDLHLCVIDEDQVVGTVPEAIDRLAATRPLTWIAGPSATSDIELDRVEGVHGPRTLIVLIVSG